MLLHGLYATAFPRKISPRDWEQQTVLESNCFHLTTTEKQIWWDKMQLCACYCFSYGLSNSHLRRCSVTISCLHAFRLLLCLKTTHKLYLMRILSLLLQRRNLVCSLRHSENVWKGLKRRGNWVWDHLHALTGSSWKKVHVGGHWFKFLFHRWQTLSLLYSCLH